MSGATFLKTKDAFLSSERESLYLLVWMTFSDFMRSSIVVDLSLLLLPTLKEGGGGGTKKQSEFI